jgi:hypothetical protein
MDDMDSKTQASSVSPPTSQPTNFSLDSLATSVATSNVFSAALANVLPQFNQALQPTIATLPSLIASSNASPSFLPAVTSVLPATSIALPVTTTSSFQPINVLQATSIGGFVQPSLTIQQIQQQQATMTLLQNATELAAREQQQNELRLASAQVEKQAESPSIAFLPFQQPSGPSVLQRLHDGYANYQASQKSLYTVMNPEQIFSAELYRLVKHSEHVKMERGCLSLMFSMVNDYFQPFDTLDHALKVC